MAAPQAPKAQIEKMDLVAGEAIAFPEAAQERALAELLLLRCGDTRLIGSQILDQARLCGRAVKAAFEELGKEVKSKE